MAFGCLVYHGHMIGRSDEKHPETGKTLYGISELKKPLDQPLLTTIKQCKQYIREVDPYDIGERVDAFGCKRKDFDKRRHKGSRASATKMEAYYGRIFAGYET